MKHTDQSHLEDHAGVLPIDLVPIAAALDALARHDRSAAPPSTEGRVYLASRSGLQQGARAGHAETDLDRLGAHERQSARGTLEDRIFLATRGLVTGAAESREVAQVHVRRIAWGRHAMRLAAAIALAVGLGVVILSLQRSASNDQSLATIELKAALDRDAELLGTALQVAFYSDAADPLDSSGEETDSSAIDWFDLDGIIDEGSL